MQGTLTKMPVLRVTLSNNISWKDTQISANQAITAVAVSLKAIEMICDYHVYHARCVRC